MSDELIVQEIEQKLVMVGRRRARHLKLVADDEAELRALVVSADRAFVSKSRIAVLAGLNRNTIHTWLRGEEVG